MNFEHLLGDIPNYSSWGKIHPITKGYSSDKKYYVESDTGEKMLLRISDISHFQVKQQDFENLQKIAKLDLNMSLPLDFGICANNTHVFSLFTWVEGEDAEVLLKKESAKSQYTYGVKAGKMLKKIHSVPAPFSQTKWEVRYRRKILQKIQNYTHCAVKLDQGEKIIQFLHKNMIYLANRPQVLHHGDFHIGNIIMSRDHEMGIIDFNRMDFGDPWEEFNRCVFSWRVSVPFTLGQIHGYFNNQVPDLFLRLMAVYVAANTIGSISWAVPFGKDEVAFMCTMAEEILEYYDGFNTYVPLWYEAPPFLGV